MAIRKKCLVDTSVIIALLRKNVLPDCLIAGYALFYDLELLTFNKKDFAYIHGVKIHPLSR